MFSIVGLLILFAAVLGSAAMAGVLTLLWHRSRRLDAPDATRHELQALREELELTRSTTRELSERLDFMERLLEAGDEDEREKP